MLHAIHADPRFLLKKVVYPQTPVLYVENTVLIANTMHAPQHIH